MNKSILQGIRGAAHLADLWLPSKIRYENIPGLSVGIFHKGRLVYRKGFGYADLSTKRKPTEKTLYHVASHSKMFTAVAVMKLVEEGKLRLDDKITDHIPWFKVASKGKDSSYITIRQLLSHTGGVFRDGTTPFWRTGRFPKKIRGIVEPGFLSHENLSDFKYTNYGYALLGEIVTAASGMPYAAYVTRKILHPLGLTNTHPDYAPGLHGMATGYPGYIPDVNRHAMKHVAANAYASATGFVSNVEDVMKFISTFSATHPKQIISTGSKRELLFPVGHIGDDRYGLGFDIDSIKGRKVIGHGGGYPGFITRTLFDPQSDVGVIVFANASGSPASAIATALLEAVYEYMGVGAQLPHASRYEGVFRDDWGDSIFIAKGKKLISFGPRSQYPLRSTYVLQPDKKPGSFIINTEDKFASYGESVVFTGLRNGKYTKALFPADYLMRVA